MSAELQQKFAPTLLPVAISALFIAILHFVTAKIIHLCIQAINLEAKREVIANPDATAAESQSDYWRSPTFSRSKSESVIM